MQSGPALITTFLLAASCTAQRIEDFDLYQSETNVIIKFNVTPGASCSGFSVLHGLDSANYELLFNDPGICGNQPVKEVKTYTHPGPAAGLTHFYRIRLEPFVELSDPKSIYVQAPADKELLMFPNPQFPGQEALNFRIPDNTLTHLAALVYEYSGRFLGTQDLSFKNSCWTLNTADLNNGIYFIRFVNYLSSRSFKFVVLR